MPNYFFYTLITFCTTQAFAAGDPPKKPQAQISAFEKLNILNQKDFVLRIPSFISYKREVLIKNMKELRNLLNFYTIPSESFSDKPKPHTCFALSESLTREILKHPKNQAEQTFEALITQKKFWESLKEKGIRIHFYVQGESKIKDWAIIIDFFPLENIVPSFLKRLNIQKIFAEYKEVKGKEVLVYQKQNSSQKIQHFVQPSVPIHHLLFSQIDVDKYAARLIKTCTPHLVSLKFQDCFFENLPVFEKQEAKNLKVLHLGFQKNKYLKFFSNTFPESLLQQLTELKIEGYDQFWEEFTPHTPVHIGNKPLEDNPQQQLLVEKEEILKEKAEEEISIEKEEVSVEKEEILNKKAENTVKADFQLEKLSLCLPENAYLISLQLFTLPHLKSLKLECFDHIFEYKTKTSENQAQSDFLSKNFYNKTFPTWPMFANAALPSLTSLSLKSGVLLKNLGKIFDPEKIKKLIVYGPYKYQNRPASANVIDLSQFPNLETFGSQISQSYAQTLTHLTHPKLKKWVILNPQDLVCPGSQYNFPCLEVIQLKAPEFKNYKGNYYDFHADDIEFHYPQWKVDNCLTQDLLEHQKNSTLTLLMNRSEDPISTLSEKYTSFYPNRKINIETFQDKVKIVSTYIEEKELPIKKLF
jgi:hypothetical protein